MKDIHLRLGHESYAALEKFAAKRNIPKASAAALILNEWIYGRDYVPPPEPPKAQYIYCIKLGDLYKIGRSVNPGKRVKGMQLPAEPHSDSFQWLTFNSVSLEKRLHKTFAGKRVHGEWFRLDEDDLDLLNNICGADIMEKLS